MENEKNIKENTEEFYSKVNLSKYQDRSGLTVSKMNLSLWILSYKKPIKILTISILIAFSVITWFFFFRTYGFYLLKNSQLDTATISNMSATNFPDYRVLDSISAKDLIISEQRVLSNGQGRFDYIAKIKNVNEKYWAEFDYYLDTGSEKYDEEKGFILPGEEKYLFILGLESDDRLKSAKLVFENFNWEIVDGKKISNWQEFKNDKINFSINEKKFIPAFSSNLSEKLKLSVVEFDVTNNTAYNYYNIDFNIFLYNKGTLVSVGKGIVENLLANNSKHVNITWPGQLSYADKIEVVPEINIMAPGTYFIE